MVGVTNSDSLVFANLWFLLLPKNLSYWSSFCENWALIGESYLKPLRCKFLGNLTEEKAKKIQVKV